MTEYLKVHQTQKLACHSSAFIFELPEKLLAKKQTYLIALLE